MPGVNTTENRALNRVAVIIKEIFIIVTISPLSRKPLYGNKNLNTHPAALYVKFMTEAGVDWEAVRATVKHPTPVWVSKQAVKSQEMKSYILRDNGELAV